MELLDLLTSLKRSPVLVKELISVIERDPEQLSSAIKQDLQSHIPDLLNSEYVTDTLNLLSKICEYELISLFYNKEFLFFIVDYVYKCILMLNKAEKSSESESSQKTDSIKLSPKKNQKVLISLLNLIEKLILNDSKSLIYIILESLGLFILIQNVDFYIVENIYQLIYKNVIYMKLFFKTEDFNEKNIKINKGGIFEYNRKHFEPITVLKSRSVVDFYPLLENKIQSFEMHEKLLNERILILKNVVLFYVSKNTFCTIENKGYYCNYEYLVYNKTFINNLISFLESSTELETDLEILKYILLKIYFKDDCYLFSSLDTNFLLRNLDLTKNTSLCIDLLYILEHLYFKFNSSSCLSKVINQENIAILFDQLKYLKPGSSEYFYFRECYTSKILFIINGSVNFIPHNYFAKMSYFALLYSINSEESKRILKITIKYLKEDSLNFGRIFFDQANKKKSKEKNKDVLENETNEVN